MVRDIYLAKIHFTDEKGYKIRPILLIKENCFTDYIFVPLTTNLNTKGIFIDQSNIETGILPKQSVIVTEKISIISPSLLTKHIASINQKTYKQLIESIIDFIGNYEKLQ